MKNSFMGFAAAKGAVVIGVEEAENDVEFRGKLRLQGKNFTKDLFVSLEESVPIELIGKTSEEEFARKVNWAEHRLKPIGTESKKILVTLKATNSPLVIPPAFSHLQNLIRTAARAHFGNTNIDANRTYVELLFGQGSLNLGEQSFANKGIHVDTSASTALAGGLRNEDVFICSHSEPANPECTTDFFEGPILLDRKKYAGLRGDRNLRGKLKKAVDEAFRKDISDYCMKLPIRRSEPLEIWRFSPTTGHRQSPVLTSVFRTAAVLAFFESDKNIIHNNKVLWGYFRAIKAAP